MTYLRIRIQSTEEAAYEMRCKISFADLTNAQRGVTRCYALNYIYRGGLGIKVTRKFLIQAQVADALMVTEPARVTKSAEWHI